MSFLAHPVDPIGSELLETSVKWSSVAQPLARGAHAAHNGLLAGPRHPRQNIKHMMHEIMCLASYSLTVLHTFWTWFQWCVPPTTNFTREHT